MLKLVTEKQFKKDFKKCKKHNKDIKRIKTIIELLIKEKLLPSKFRNHKLKGFYVGYWECHIEPNWLLIYKKTETSI